MNCCCQTPSIFYCTFSDLHKQRKPEKKRIKNQYWVLLVLSNETWKLPKTSNSNENSFKMWKNSTLQAAHKKLTHKTTIKQLLRN